MRIFRAAMSIAVVALAACSSSGTRSHEVATPTEPAVLPVAVSAADAAAPRVNGERAFGYLKEIVGFGPRWVSSPGQKKQQDYVKARLKGDTVEEDVFTATTPAGKLEMRNIIAKYAGTEDKVIVVASHYDTLYDKKDFVGANDGGSSTALLLELANQLRGKKLNGPSVWLVWFDGEEAFEQWTDTDSVYGSRHLAAKWKQDGTSKKVKALLLTDMIGDSDLNIDSDSNSAKWLGDLIYKAASNLGVQSHFYARRIAIEDDHTPFVQAGVPCVDLIDFDYGYNNVFWHTKEDTLDKNSAKSLQITGDVVLESLRLLGVKF
jgi:glutaminyl-peptide cyclotransferase